MAPSGAPSFTRPTLDLYTTEGEAVTDVIGTRRNRGAGIKIEPTRIRRRRGREQPIVAVGSLIEQLTIGVDTEPRRGEEKARSARFSLSRPTLDLYTTEGEAVPDAIALRQIRSVFREAESPC